MCDAWRKVTADRIENARAQRVALLLSMIQDAAREASSKAMAARVRARRLTLLLDITHDAASDAWLKVAADRAEKARARRAALLLAIVQDAARDASRRVTATGITKAREQACKALNKTSAKTDADSTLSYAMVADSDTDSDADSIATDVAVVEDEEFSQYMKLRYGIILESMRATKQ